MHTQNVSGTLSSRIKLYRLLGHVLPMGPLCLSHWALFSIPRERWKKRPGGQQVTWQREMKNASISLPRVGSSRLPGCGP